MYCNKRSKLDGLDTVYSYDEISATNATNLICNWNSIGYRLPTEDEWELAARAGQQFKYATYNGEISEAHANYNSNSTVDVASYPPNPYGLYDMSGNVYEWCWDWHGNMDSTPKRTDGRIDFKGASTYTCRTIRGGAWVRMNPNDLSNGYRQCGEPSRRGSSEDGGQGFRVVIPVQ
jgi:formylglycine-generating enzyme required for sulfatase activity